MAEACIAVMGPRSRELLAPIVPQPLTNAAFPYGTFQHIEIGMARARAHRVSYVGELGWEIYVPVDMARHVFDAIMVRAREHGALLCGVHTLDSCRLEKAYRHYGHDISSADHVLDAGLGFAVKIAGAGGRSRDFIGREAVEARRRSGPSSRLAQFLIGDPLPLLYGYEAIWRDGKVAGYLTSGGYGHHLGAGVGLGYLRCEPGETAQDVLRSRYEIEIAEKRYPARASLKPLYDPSGSRMKV